MPGNLIGPAPPGFRFSAHVHACLSGTHVVLLDLRRDRYIAVDAAEAAGLRRFIFDWPGNLSDATDRSETETAAHEAVDAMLADGLIVREHAIDWSGRTRTAPISGVVRSLFDTTPVSISTPRARQLIAFAYAVTHAKIEHAVLPIRFVIGNFKRRRESLPKNRIDTEQLQHLVMAFLRLRPFLFRSRDSCLFDCMALARYLVHFGVPCRWIFGVQDGPFAAHCWLTYEDRLLNDTPEHVAQYTPILEV